MLPSMFCLLEAMFLEAAVLLVFICEISSSDTRGKRAWSTAIVLVFEVFSTEEILAYYAVVYQSGGCLPPFAVVAKRSTMLFRAELHMNMSTYPQRNSSG